MTTERTPSEQLSMSDHPDIIELRNRLDRVSETPQAWTVEGLAVIAGLYVAISPWVVNFHGLNTSLTVSDLIVGLAAAVLAGGLGSAYSHAHGMSWVLPISGAWVIASMWAIHGTTLNLGVLLSNIIAGGCLLLLGLGSMGVQMMRTPTRKPAHR